MCPFCYIGKRKFENALNQFTGKDNIEIRWRSFQLAPDLKTDTSKSVYDYLAERKGWNPDYSRKVHYQLEATAKEVGLEYDFDRAIPANSFKAHRFSHLAAKYNLQDVAEERLFAAYFTEGRNIDDNETLIQLGNDMGLDPVEVTRALENGDYGDAVEELDWSAGEIVQALQRLNLSDQTLVIWTSDNGAVQRNPPQGSCAPYKGWGYDTSEGAMRMPCVMRFPGQIPANHDCDEIVTTMDFLPTFAHLAGASLPAKPIDGHDVRPLLFDEPSAKSPWDEQGFMYYRMEQLQAVRSGPWKLYLPLAEKFIANNRKTAPGQLQLFDVRNDVGETREVSAKNAGVVQRLTALAEVARLKFGDTNRPGREQRPAGHVANPVPLTK